ncbi:transposase family protein [Streptomyces phaeoluteigriseus]|uniref:Transposase family protein n=1 Tax=Streptomyces phaeoluteigriseus TaxID=114686 RepID=A0ABY4Z6N6_9ACTN|nr:transposase family protein [Streptomyces phaeoluteigriseus]USQ84719.1 transposase family protein [Streptomyces phaeoluteigriseus]
MFEHVGRPLNAARERGGDGCVWGRPWRLPLAERVLLVAVYNRTNLTMRQLAPPSDISSATVCRVIQHLGPLLALEPVRASQDALERIWIVDGSRIPAHDRSVGTSSRNLRFSANVAADTRLVVAASGRCLVRRRMRRPGGTRAWPSSARASLRRACDRLLKNYKMLRDCQQHGDGLHHAVQGVASSTTSPWPRAQTPQQASRKPTHGVVYSAPANEVSVGGGRVQGVPLVDEVTACCQWGACCQWLHDHDVRPQRKGGVAPRRAAVPRVKSHPMICALASGLNVM